MIAIALTLCAWPMPSTSNDDVVAAAASAGRFGRLLAAAEAADLVEVLCSPGPWTVLAPTDAAFQRLGEVMADPKTLRCLLLGHVIEGRLTVADLVTGGPRKTAAGSMLRFTIRDGVVRVGDARVMMSDVGAGNGVVHGIDHVLTPRRCSPAAVFDARAAAEMRMQRVAVARELDAALDSDPGADRLRAIAGRAADELAGTRMAEHLRSIAVAATSDAVERQLERVIDDLRFEAVEEAPLPVGWPPLAPVGEIVVKRYPRYRMAVSDMRGGAMTRPFMALFRHIQANDIAMTAPVQLDHRDAPRNAVDRGDRMGFLYRRPDMGAVGQDGQVEVVDIEPVTAVSIGARGSDSGKRVAELATELRRWITRSGEYRAAGPMRVMGYNSPSVLGNRRFFEVEIPVRAARRKGPAF